jgi:hypothetical protein
MKREKIYYVPGLISIVALPVLLFFRGPENYNYQSVIRLNMPSYAKDTNGIKKFTIGYVYEAIKNKKLIAIDLNDAFTDSEMYLEARQFDFITTEIERLQFTHDTTTVLRVQFGDRCTYGDFIWVLNHALVYDFKRYALVDNALYFFPSPRFIPYIETTDMHLDDYILPQQETPSWWDEFKISLRYKWSDIQYQFKYLFYQQQQNKLLIIGFLLLVGLPAIIKIRQYARRKRQLVLASQNS